MIDLAAIKQRHAEFMADQAQLEPPSPYIRKLFKVYEDRAALLAEVDRLNGLCGRALPAVSLEAACSAQQEERAYWAILETELREAAK